MRLLFHSSIIQKHWCGDESGFEQRMSLLIHSPTVTPAMTFWFLAPVPQITVHIRRPGQSDVILPETEWVLSSEVFMFIFSQTVREKNSSFCYWAREWEKMHRKSGDSETWQVLQNLVIGHSHTLHSWTLHQCYQFISVYVCSHLKMWTYFSCFMFFWTDNSWKWGKDIVRLSYAALEGGACLALMLPAVANCNHLCTHEPYKR